MELGWVENKSQMKVLQKLRMSVYGRYSKNSQQYETSLSSVQKEISDILKVTWASALMTVGHAIYWTAGRGLISPMFQL